MNKPPNKNMPKFGMMHFILVMLASLLSMPAFAIPMSLKDIPIQEPANLPAFLKVNPTPQVPGAIEVDEAARTAALQLGKALFWDMRLGSDDNVACATCHFNAGADPRFKNQLSPGYLSSPMPVGPFPQPADVPQPPAAHKVDATFGNSAIAGIPGPNDRPFRYGFGINYILKAINFPFHRRPNPTLPGDGYVNKNQVSMDTNDVTSSQGIAQAFPPGSAANQLNLEPRDNVFNWRGRNVRRSAERNTPSAVNAGFFVDQFWDGRASHVFNGSNPFGFLDTKSTSKRNCGTANDNVCVHRYLDEEGVERTVDLAGEQETFVRIPMMPHASQAVGPPLSLRELSGHSRNFTEIAQKFLNQNPVPLATQNVHPQDSLLGPLANTAPTVVQSRDRRNRLVTTTTAPKGLNTTYPALIRAAFKDEWVGSPQLMEANFPLIFGIATALYQNTLVSDDTPYDQFFGAGNDCPVDLVALGAAGVPFFDPENILDCAPNPAFVPARDNVATGVNPDAMTDQEQRGFVVFQQALCVVCHILPETSSGTQRFAGLLAANPLTNSARGTILDPNTGKVMPTEQVANPNIIDPNTLQPIIETRLVQDPLNPVNVVVPTLKMELMPAAVINFGLPQTAADVGVYDVGFYNIGVRPTEEDIGRANLSPPQDVPGYADGFPLSFTEMGLLKYLGDLGQPKFGTTVPPAPLPDGVREYVPDTGILALPATFPPNPLAPIIEVPGATLAQLFGTANNPEQRVITRGAFKTPIIRNQEYQGPYFHNGGDATLRRVVEFYARAGNFPVTNLENFSPDMAPIPLLDLNVVGVNPADTRRLRAENLQNMQDLVAFLSNALTDQRVVRSAAPFDHPEIRIPVGENRSTRLPESFTTLPATGRTGSNLSASRFLGLNPQAQ